VPKTMKLYLNLSKFMYSKPDSFFPGHSVRDSETGTKHH